MTSPFILLIPLFAVADTNNNTLKKSICPALGAEISYPYGPSFALGIKQRSKTETFNYTTHFAEANIGYTSYGVNIGFGNMSTEILPVGCAYALSYQRLHKAFSTARGDNLVGGTLRLLVAITVTLSAHYNIEDEKMRYAAGVGYWLP